MKTEVLESRERLRTRAERLERAKASGLSYSGGEFYPETMLVWAKGFYNGLAKITLNGRVGFINSKGDLVVKATLKDAGYFSENLAPFESDGGKWGYIDSQGKLKIEPRFDWALSFKEGLALVQSGGLWGFIDRNGKFVIEPQFESAASFSEGLAQAGFYDKRFVSEFAPKGTWQTGFIDRQGNWAIKSTNGVAHCSFNGGMTIVSGWTKNDDEIKHDVSVIDKSGKELWKLNTRSIYGFNEDTLVVEFKEEKGANGQYRNSLYTFVDRSGKRMTDKTFQVLAGFSEGLSVAKIKIDEDFGFIDKSGEFVIAPKFSFARGFSEGLAAVKTVDEDGLYERFGFIDKSGNWVIKPQFKWVEDFQESFALVAHDGRYSNPEKFGYIDRKGKYIWKPTR